jgi:hypothetical protein
VTASAGRTIQHKLPEGVAAAVIEFITGTLLGTLHRVGHALHHELTGVHALNTAPMCTAHVKITWISPVSKIRGTAWPSHRVGPPHGCVGPVLDRHPARVRRFGWGSYAPPRSRATRRQPVDRYSVNPLPV